MVDIHCHILPETDDGAKTWETAVEMCRIAAADGITHLVATPHANDTYVYDRERHRQTLNELRALCPAGPRLGLGCDFHFSFQNVAAVAVSPHTFTIESTPYLLVELSDFSIPPNLGRHFAELCERGLRPILTHPERNPLVRSKPEAVLDWVAAGAYVQVTANALTGRWGKQTQKLAQWLLKKDAVHVLATDAHDTRSRPPILSEGREAAARLTNESVAQALTVDNPAAIIRGLPLPYAAG